GCDASVILASPNNQAEKDHPDDLSLAGDGFDTVIKAKAAVDSNPQCRNKVSCADILALATRDVVNLVGGPYYEVELGRRDGRISTIASVQRRLPLPGFNLDQLNSLFSINGLSQTDMIALSGAHTIGFSHCNRFSKRIYNFSPQNRIDPTLNLQYALNLRQSCPLNVDPHVAITMDPFTPQQFDNQYFKNLQQGMGLFTSDQVLFTDARSKGTVNLFASSEAAFRSAFVTAITKLGRCECSSGPLTQPPPPFPINKIKTKLGNRGTVASRWRRPLVPAVVCVLRALAIVAPLQLLHVSSITAAPARGLCRCCMCPPPLLYVSSIDLQHRRRAIAAADP
ncbi:Secretory peroxidase, partial [Sesbania bispinosa]